jgi:hypothetical protein
MNDAELDRLIAQDMMKSAQPEMADADLDQLIYQDMLTQPEPQQDSFLSQVGQGALKGVAAAGQFIDRFTGAPTRAALGQAVSGSVLDAPGAFISQFGADPSLAPTGKEIVQAAGLPEFDIIDDPAKDIDRQLEAQGFTVSKSPNAGLTSTGVAGLAVDVLADWSNYVPFGAVIKGTGKVAKETTKAAGKTTLALIDTATGTKIASRSADDAIRAIDSVVESTKKAFKPTVADDFAEYAAIAQKNGIDPKILPETVEFGPSSTITKKAQVVAEGPAGELVQERFRKAQFEIENALDRKVTELGGGIRASDAQAGQALLDSYNGAIKKFFDQDFVTNNKIIQENPGLVLTKNSTKAIESKLKGMSNFAAGRMKRGLKDQRVQAAALNDAVETIKRSFKDGKISYKNANEALSNIGEEAFKKFKGDDPMGAIYRDQLKDLYFTMRESMNSSVAGKVSKTTATELANSNLIISDFLKDKGTIQRIMKADIAPEKIAKAMVENPNTLQLEALQKMFQMSGDTEALKQFKGFVADKLIKKNASGSPLYRTTINNLSKKKDVAAVLFTPKEITELGEVLKLGDRTGDFILNTSKTNTASRFSPKEFLSNIMASGTDQVTLERLKDIARGKAQAQALQTAQGAVQVTKKQAQEFLPLFNKKFDRYKLKEAGKIQGTQELNRDLEQERMRRQQAMQ